MSFNIDRDNIEIHPKDSLSDEKWKKLKDILAKLTGEIDLDEVYEELLSKEKEQKNKDIYKDISELSERFSKMIDKSITRIGSDLPIIIKRTDGKNNKLPKVMLITVDSLRKDTEGKIEFGTPFALHLKGDRQSGVAPTFLSLIEDWLGFGSDRKQKFSSIYFTDLVKLYLGRRKVSIRWNIWKETFTKILNSEIKIFRPDLIIGLGYIVRNWSKYGKNITDGAMIEDISIEDNSSEKFTFISWVHPSAYNNDYKTFIDNTNDKFQKEFSYKQDNKSMAEAIIKFTNEHFLNKK